MCLTRGGVREGAGAGECVGEKPAEMKACNGGPCVPTTIWYSSPWTEVGQKKIQIIFFIFSCFLFLFLFFVMTHLQYNIISSLNAKSLFIISSAGYMRELTCQL